MVKRRHKGILEAIGPEGLIVVYSSYEQTNIKQLAEECPQYEERLLALCDRLFDLLAVVRTHCYHPDFHGSYSLKAVLPALVPEMTYSNLDKQGGSTASVAFAQMIAPDREEPELGRLRGVVLDYCERDTQAMVRLLLVLLSSMEGG